MMNPLRLNQLLPYNFLPLTIVRLMKLHHLHLRRRRVGILRRRRQQLHKHQQSSFVQPQLMKQLM
jgi:hypothetical protein